jgi:hypothetical protein
MGLAPLKLTVVLSNNNLPYGIGNMSSSTATTSSSFVTTNMETELDILFKLTRLTESIGLTTDSEQLAAVYKQKSELIELLSDLHRDNNPQEKMETASDDDNQLHNPFAVDDNACSLPVTLVVEPTTTPIPITAEDVRARHSAATDAAASCRTRTLQPIVIDDVLRIVNDGRRYKPRGRTEEYRIPEDISTGLAMRYFGVDAYQR